MTKAYAFIQLPLQKPVFMHNLPFLLHNCFGQLFLTAVNISLLGTLVLKRLDHNAFGQW